MNGSLCEYFTVIEPRGSALASASRHQLAPTTPSKITGALVPPEPFTLADIIDSPAYIAGVTNPIFEQLGTWDVLFNIATGNVTISKDILTTYPPTPPAAGFGSASISRERAATLRTENSIGSEDGTGRDASKTDNADNLFIEDVSPPRISLAVCRTDFCRSARLSTITTARTQFVYDLRSM